MLQLTLGAALTAHTPTCHHYRHHLPRCRPALAVATTTVAATIATSVTTSAAVAAAATTDTADSPLVATIATIPTLAPAACTLCVTWHAAVALAVVVALLFSLAFIVCLLWRRLRWRRISVFISYRAASDQKLVEQLFHRLLALNLRVWWDVKCLKPGQPWEDGFADGLFTSTVFVPVLSKAGSSACAPRGRIALR